MNEISNSTDNYTRLSRCSLWIVLSGTMTYLLIFPSGIFYGFFLSVIGTAGAILSRPYSEKPRQAAFAILAGVFNIAFCLMAYHGLDAIYSSLSDPEAGPVISNYVISVFEQYGLSAETFVRLMQM